MNKGGFSWWRFFGITKVKQDISKTTGIPYKAEMLRRD